MYVSPNLIPYSLINWVQAMEGTRPVRYPSRLARKNSCSRFDNWSEEYPYMSCSETSSSSSDDDDLFYFVLHVPSLGHRFKKSFIPGIPRPFTFLQSSFQSYHHSMRRIPGDALDPHDRHPALCCKYPPNPEMNCRQFKRMKRTGKTFPTLSIPRS